MAVISPAIHNQYNKANKPFFTDKAPQAAVYLNLDLTNNYCPELASGEDMVFAIECVKSGLTVCRWNRVQLKDIGWKNTGTTAPYKTSPQKEEELPLILIWLWEEERAKKNK